MLDAALELLGRDGYSRMSIERVAAAAGVTRPTVYRRWPTKAALATDALAALAATEHRPDTGSARDDLVGLLRAFRRSLLRPNGMATLGTVLAEEAHTPELVAHFRERLVAPRRTAIRTVLARGVERGEIDRAADLDTAINAIVGSFYARYLANGTIPRDWPERIVAFVWPSLTPGRAR